MLRAGSKIELLIDQDVTIRIEYLMLKTVVFGSFVGLTPFSPHFGLAWLSYSAKPTDWASCGLKNCSSYKKSETSFEVLEY